MERLIVGDEDCSFNEIVSELDLLPTSSVFVYDWRKFSKALNTPNMKEAQLEQDLLLKRKQPIDVVADLLLEWRSRQNRKATMSILLEILEYRCGWKEVADSLRNKYKLKIHKTTQWNDLDKVTKSEILSLQVNFLNKTTTVHQCISLFDENLQETLINKHLNGPLLRQLLKFRTDPFPLTTATIPEKPKYYIPRTITTRRQLNPEIFTTVCSDIFLFENIDFPDLSKLAGKERADRSTSQLTKLSVKFILLEFEEDFEQICKISKHSSVHNIIYDDGKLIWKRTHGSLSLIQQHIHEEQECIPEDQFVEILGDEQDQLPVCISDSPGMGKSVLLANMARNLSSKFTNRIAVYIPISDFIKTLKNHDGYHSELMWSKLGPLISLYLAANDFGCDILTNLINNPAQKIDLFFDGFDEILADQEKIAVQVLKCILTQKENIRLVVSTRPHKLSLLENTLGTLGFNIQPFTCSDQINFLQQYWWYNYKIQVNSNLNDFAKYLVDVLAENFEKGGKSSSEIAGIPLQCAILADIYEKDAKKYSKVKKDVFTIAVKIGTIADMYEALMKTKFLRCEETEKREILKRAHVYAAFVVLFPDWLNHFELFDESMDDIGHKEIFTIGVIERIEENLKNKNLPVFRFVHRTYAEYLVAEFIMKNFSTLQQDSNNGDTLMNFLFKEIFQLDQFDNNLIIGRKGCAIDYVTDTLKDIPENEDYKNNWVSLAKYLGLDESTISDLEWRLQYLRNDREMCDPLYKLLDTWVDIFREKAKLNRLIESLEYCKWNSLSDALKRKFYTTCFRYPNISYFLESQLEPNIDQILNTVSKNEIFCSDVETSHYNILKCCVTLEYSSLFKLVSQLFLQSGLSINEKENLPQILCFAAEFSTSNLFVECCEFVETVLQTPIQELNFIWTIQTLMMNYVECTPLHIAVWYGKDGTADYLIKKYGEHISSLKCLLHFLVGDSLKDSDVEIGQKIGIAKMIIENSPDRLNEKDNLERTPIYTGKVHFRLVEYLINAGASVYPITGYEGPTLAHNAAVIYNPTDFHLFCVLMIEKGFGSLFRMHFSKKSSTPIHIALFNKDVKIETIDLLAKKLHINFNTVDSYLDSELFAAIKGGRNKKLLEALVRNGANWKMTRYQGLGILHYAGWFGNLEAVEYFISLGADVNARDELGATPLHSVIKLCRKNVHEIVLLLIENNADVSIKDRYGFTPVMYGLLEQEENRIEERTVELLVSKGDGNGEKLDSEKFWSRCKVCLCL